MGGWRLSRSGRGRRGAGSSAGSRGLGFRSLGPGLVSGAADTDPTTVATLVVVGASTMFGLAWLTLLMMPALVVVQVLATRVGVLSGRDLQRAVRDGYGRVVSVLFLVSVLAVNVVTVAADVAAGAAAIGLLVGVDSRWLVPGFAAGVLALLLWGKYDEVERVLKLVMLGLLAYGLAAILARPDWLAVARGSLVPAVPFTREHLAGMLAILGTTLTSYMYVWQTVEQVEEPCSRRELRYREFDGLVGGGLAAVIFWCILVASGATLGAHHQHVDTAEQAAQALRPLAGPLAGAVFAGGLLASAIIAVPVIMASGGYVTASAFGWPRGLSRTPRQAPRFYAVVVVQALAGVALAMAGIGPIRLLFAASLIGGVATPLGLVLLVLAAGNPKLVGPSRIHVGLRVAGWVIAALVATVTVIFLAQRVHLLPG
ncbi:NRAMP (natural resistance-associated macrophage protein) metal ion transporters [Micromonospora narathiwatensis]|uniref:NRAMP (Natural resistance-associated macrophage protein) metal ion transporters n=1 Tax=Micromonospora narathiwatensis TaxID=299146 RepID=A0A1A8ZN98_9ACTN|nr:NRAMP (natural resistance-associated macrophage protein) metal ion transporters [Micromonospora narathiwatensis]